MFGNKLPKTRYPPFLMHTNINLSSYRSVSAFLLFFLTVFISACGADSALPTPPAPLLIIMGEDISQTFGQFAPITPPDLQKLCETVAKHPTGGTICFAVIGNPTPTGYQTCEITGLKTPQKGATVSAIAEVKRQNQAIRQENQERAEQFVTACTNMTNRKHQETDINGFFRKAATWANEVNYEGYAKYLFINSDGKQSLKNGSNQVDCTLRPSSAKYFVSGWTTPDNCGCSKPMQSPQGFVSYIRQESDQLKSAR
jgi:hypothetical protein